MDVEEVLFSNFKNYIDCFEMDNSGGKPKYICKGCKKEYADKSGAIRHLKKSHNEMYEAVKYNKLANPGESVNIPELELRVKVRPDDIWSACVDLVTINALPLAIVESPPFQKLLKPYVTALKLKGIDLVINRRNIKDHISQRAEKIKENIRKDTKNKVLSLMIDIATRYNRSVLGINVAFMKGGKICIRTLGMIVLNFTHTAANVVKIIKETLSSYEIRLEQIVSVTTDNGRNMIKTIALLDESFQQTRSEMSEGDYNDEEYIDCGVFDEEYYTDLLGRVRSAFGNTDYIDLVHGISCGVHCLHLVVTKAIDDSTVTKDLINHCRELVKLLRTPTFHTQLTKDKIKQAIIDVETRWNSVYAMLERMILLKEFCVKQTTDREMKKRILSDDEWARVMDLLLVLKPFNKYVKMLQAENVTLSDFFGFWTAMRIKLSRGEDDLSQKLLQHMNNYHERLIKNPALAAAVFLDPRYQRALKGDKTVAIQFLVSLYRKIRNVENYGAPEPELVLVSTDNQSDGESLQDLEDYLNACRSVAGTDENVCLNPSNDDINNNNITERLHEFVGVEQPLTTSVLDYWESEKKSRPELYKLASVVYAIPPTQTTIERGFSSLPIVLTARRTRLSDDCLQNILLIRLNYKNYTETSITTTELVE